MDTFIRQKVRLICRLEHFSFVNSHLLDEVAIYGASFRCVYTHLEDEAKPCKISLAVFQDS